VVAQSVKCLTTEWMSGIQSLTAKDFTCSLCIQTRPTQSPLQWVPGVKHGRGVTLTTHPHLVPRSRLSRSYLPSAPWYQCGGNGQLYVLLYGACLVLIMSYFNSRMLPNCHTSVSSDSLLNLLDTVVLSISGPSFLDRFVSVRCSVWLGYS
jgi:hypothetical protein